MKKVFIIFAITFFCIPAVTSAFAPGSGDISLLTESAIVIDEESGEILFEKNADQKMYPASLTKMATAIYAIEKADLQDKVTVSEKAREVDGTRVYLEPGEVVTLDKLVKGLLVNSGNDAGLAIAEHMSGNGKAFSEELNKYLKEEVGLRNTHFENPHGLYHPKHQTTAKDLAALTKYALKNPTFSKYFGMKKLDWKGEGWETTIISHHKLLIDPSNEDVTGGKTGFVSQSGTTLSTSAERDGLKVIVITLKSESQNVAYQETSKLLDYAFDHYETNSIPDNKVYKADGNEFITPEELHYAKPKDQAIEEKVTGDGRLEIHSEDKLLTSFQLEKKEEPETQVSLQAESTTSPNHWIFDLFYYWQTSITKLIN
ncbi:D-alanyl-D-alanine carboxypeptidase family protein [Halobacillus massiliensis]|uniref:D-alanyl-D-alanine carboxypeptidase family protein n=1 Tax=Halobacillus massiliensis TaxID=1926286 RepID=UPI0009E396D1|nr:D-alanyl-D-alanine carboxypeptidase family protein [Halobacillus massiliensis]